MKWDEAVTRTGWAYRNLPNGQVSVKAKDGRQWTVRKDKVVEVLGRYQRRANEFRNWESLEIGSSVHEVMVLSGLIVRPGDVRTGLLAQFQQATDLISDLKTMASHVDLSQSDVLDTLSKMGVVLDTLKAML